MNKQEALVAVLAQCRRYEQPHEETRRVDVTVAVDDLLRAAEDLRSELPSAEEERVALVALAGAALYLLVDEVEIVAGRTLEMWIKDQRLLGRPSNLELVGVPLRMERSGSAEG